MEDTAKIENKIIYQGVEYIYGNKIQMTEAIINAGERSGPLKDRVSDSELLVRADVVYCHNTREYVKNRMTGRDFANTLLWMRRNNIDIRAILDEIETHV